MMSDKITTVSPTYAKRDPDARAGFGFDGVLRTREADSYGILNGIDTDVWDPAADSLLPVTFTPHALTARHGQARLLEMRACRGTTRP